MCLAFISLRQHNYYASQMLRVRICCSNTGEDTVAGYYSGIRGTLANGPTVINGTALGRTRNAVFSNVALFV